MVVDLQRISQYHQIHLIHGSILLSLTLFFCTPALFDLRTGADDTRVRENDNTDYYTIYGDWNPSLPCRFLGSEDMGYKFLRSIGDVPNDGIVPKWSVELLPNFTNLGHTNYCHTDVLSSQEYDTSKSLLLSGR